MKNLFAKIFGGVSKPVPEEIQELIIKHFPNALNIEWDHKKNYYEAIFYVDDVEHIAQFSEDGLFTGYKKNLWPNELPETIAVKSREWGEIMNSIAIFKDGTRTFEVIIRDSGFKRKLLLFDESANLLNKEKL